MLYVPNIHWQRFCSKSCRLTAYRAANKEELRAKARVYDRQWRKDNKEYREKNRIRQGEYYRTQQRRQYLLNRRAKKYGLTRAEFDDLMAKPCAICGDASEHMDHCHATNRVRAGLCARCNRALGAFGDSPERLRAAAAYVDEHAAKNSQYDKDTKERLK